eukprot:Rmarinus@m.10584
MDLDAVELKERVIRLRQLKKQLGAPSCASLSFLTLRELLDEICFEIGMDTLMAARSGTEVAVESDVCPKPTNGIVPAQGLDIYGQQASALGNELLECTVCRRQIGAAYFAPHLEKCMGGGRAGSRATRRLFQNRLAGSGNQVDEKASVASTVSADDDDCGDGGDSGSEAYTDSQDSAFYLNKKDAKRAASRSKAEIAAENRKKEAQKGLI